MQPAGDVDDASESSDSDIVEMQMEDKKEKWDCESILSRYHVGCLFRISHEPQIP